jgi:hypothetical protein
MWPKRSVIAKAVVDSTPVSTHNRRRRIWCEQRTCSTCQRNATTIKARDPCNAWCLLLARVPLEHLIPAYKKTIQSQLKQGGQLYFSLFENIYFVILYSKIQGETLKW